METIRTFRAIVWLRWQILKNSVAGSRNRDVLELASRTLALVVPVIIAALSIGTFIAVSVVAFMGGRAVGTGLLDGPCRCRNGRYSTHFYIDKVVVFDGSISRTAKQYADIVRNNASCPK